LVPALAVAVAISLLSALSNLLIYVHPLEMYGLIQNRWLIISSAVIGIMFVVLFYSYNNRRFFSPAAPDAIASGIGEIYPTKPGGEEWFMNMQNPTADPRFDPQTNITKNSDGSYKITKTEVRMEVNPSTGYNQDQVTTSNQRVDSKRYMQSPNDWKNVEMTGYVRLISSPSDDQFNWYNRGGHHTNAATCEGTA
jgi:hypothetical protein